MEPLEPERAAEAREARRSGEFNKNMNGIWKKWLYDTKAMKP